MRDEGWPRFHVVIPRAIRSRSSSIALSAAKTSLERRLPMADSIMLTTARHHAAVFWTQHADFDGVDGVKYVAKP